MTETKGFDLVAALKGVSNLDTGMEGREQIDYIHIDHLHQDERNFYELPGIPELAANIEFAGLQQPIRVRPDPEKEGHYIIVSGHRRHAALSQLVQEGNEKFAQVPCIVERQSGAADEVEGWLQELRLIYGNSDTRRMSSADISKQAERVEMLLYQLKEAGVEFPGKMRDHVAEACKVSASKLARLKVIRENLDGEMKEQWEAGKINESEAYNLAKLPTEHRAVIWAHKGNHSWNYSGSRAVEEFGKRLEKVDASAAPDAIPDSCPVGYCSNLGMRREASLRDSIYWDSRCAKCCHGCKDIGTCKYACPNLVSEIAEAKQAKKDERKAQKERAEEANRPTIELLTKLWRRFGILLSVGGVDLQELEHDCTEWNPPMGVQSFMALASGAKSPDVNDPTPLGWSVRLGAVRELLDLADALDCSIDYLLCRTDDSRDIPELKNLIQEWRGRSETPPVGEIIVTYDLTNDGPKYTPAVWDGHRFHAPGKPNKELTGLGQQFTKWMLLPEDE